VEKCLVSAGRRKRRIRYTGGEKLLSSPVLGANLVSDLQPIEIKHNNVLGRESERTYKIGYVGRDVGRKERIVAEKVTSKRERRAWMWASAFEGGAGDSSRGREESAQAPRRASGSLNPGSRPMQQLKPCLGSVLNKMGRGIATFRSGGRDAQEEAIIVRKPSQFFSVR